MQVLEKILEEIKEAAFQEDAPIYLGDTEVDRYVQESVVKEIIRSHMDEMNDGWIPVEERLPDSINKILYDMNLVTLEDGEVCLGVYTDDKKEWRTRRTQGETLYTTEHNVIAWQPLPEPYKPKKK